MAGTRVYVGDLLENVQKEELEKEFRRFGRLKSVWVAHNPPGFAFIEFLSSRDAETAVRTLDGKNLCGSRVRVEISRSRGPKPRPGRGGRGGQSFFGSRGRGGRSPSPSRRRFSPNRRSSPPVRRQMSPGGRGSSPPSRRPGSRDDYDSYRNGDSGRFKEEGSRYREEKRYASGGWTERSSSAQGLRSRSPVRRRYPSG